MGVNYVQSLLRYRHGEIKRIYTVVAEHNDVAMMYLNILLRGLAIAE